MAMNKSSRPAVEYIEAERLKWEMERSGLKVVRIDNGAEFRARLIRPAVTIAEGENLIIEPCASYGQCIRSLHDAWLKRGVP